MCRALVLSNAWPRHHSKSPAGLPLVAVGVDHDRSRALDGDCQLVRVRHVHLDVGELLAREGQGLADRDQGVGVVAVVVPRHTLAAGADGLAVVAWDRDDGQPRDQGANLMMA